MDSREKRHEEAAIAVKGCAYIGKMNLLLMM
jgi:hypothetical protein